MDIKVLRLLGLTVTPAHLDDWNGLLERALHPKRNCRIALVGKYAGLKDAYKSIFESLSHAGIALWTNVVCDMVEAEELEKDTSMLEKYDGVIVPGGFGARGVEGKIVSLEYARTHHLPCLGICLGMQCMVIEYARNVLGYKDADSIEFNEGTAYPVIDLMEEQKKVIGKGGTMRLGAYPCRLMDGSRAAALYGNLDISERHRHRYEFNNTYRKALAEAGLSICGTSPDEVLVEMVELPEHPFYIGCQFHPEFKSRPFMPHPLFTGLVQAALIHQEN